MFRGKHLCVDKNYATFKQVEYKYTESGGRLYKNEFRSMDSDQLFPGYLDIGTPLIIKKYYDRNTIIGMFQDQLNADSNKGPALFTKLDPEAVQWIVETADWTQKTDYKTRGSSCITHTSCSCGMENGPETRKSVNRIYSKADNTATEVEGHKYPWEVNIYSRVDTLAWKKQIDCSCYQPPLCPDASEKWTFDMQQTDQHTQNIVNTREPTKRAKYNVCSGSLITSKHVLTSAECVARNRNHPYPRRWYSTWDKIRDQDENKQDNSKLDVKYNEPECIFVLLGYPNQTNAISVKAELLRVKRIHHHPKAFTEGYNYNLGNLSFIITPLYENYSQRYLSCMALSNLAKR